MKKIWYALAVLVVTLAAGAVLIILPGKTQAPTQSGSQATTTPAGIDDLISVNAPVVSPSRLTVTGQARGNWYFEASFPLELLDASGAPIAQGPAQASGDWMTTDFVPFSATLTYPAQPAGSHGTLVLKNDNPSGDPAKERSVSIPIVF